MTSDYAAVPSGLTVAEAGTLFLCTSLLGAFQAAAAMNPRPEPDDDTLMRAYARGDATQLLQRPQDLQAALLAACDEAVRLDGAEAIVIGGGPLAGAAEALSQQLAVRVVNPVGAAVRLLCARQGVAL